MAEIYTDKYIEDCFYIWYESGKTFAKGLLNKLPTTDRGNSPNITTVQKWADENGWVERADALDAQVSVAQDNLITNRRIAMYEKHEEVAGELITQGREFLKKQMENGGLKTENAALRAIELGVEIERKSVGVSDYVRKLADMTPDQLDRELQSLLGQKYDDDITVEGEIQETKE